MAATYPACSAYPAWDLPSLGFTQPGIYWPRIYRAPDLPGPKRGGVQTYPAQGLPGPVFTRPWIYLALYLHGPGFTWP